MLRAALLALGLSLTVPAPADAQTRETLGFGRLFTNDFFGDGHDRWHTGGYNFSVVRGPGWPGRRPAAFGAILEYRLRSEIIAPSFETRRGRVDRPYAAFIAAGLYTHSSLGALDLTLGGEALLMGPQTGISDFQDWYHALWSLPEPIGAGSQLGDALHFGASAELAWPLHLSDRVTLRPYAGVEAGIEDLVRVGADVILGAVGHTDLLTRDVTTGSLIRAVEGPQTGFALIAGADWSQVDGSVFLPADLGFAALDSRWRTRAGIHWQLAPEVSFYYGLTYLSEEFEGQEGGQTLGSLKLNFNF